MEIRLIRSEPFRSGLRFALSPPGGDAEEAVWRACLRINKAAGRVRAAAMCDESDVSYSTCFDHALDMARGLLPGESVFQADLGDGDGTDITVYVAASSHEEALALLADHATGA